MTKLEKMLQEYEKAKAAKAELLQDVADLEARIAASEEEAENAAGRGDVDLYKKHRDSVQALKDTLFVRKKQLDNLAVLASEEEAKDAWGEYAEAYNKTFAKSWAAYEKARKDLCTSFMGLIDAQKKALQMRQKCADCAGIPDNGGFYQPSAYDMIFPLQLIPDEAQTVRTLEPIYEKGPDATFFLNAQIMDPSNIRMLNQVVRWHKPE